MCKQKNDISIKLQGNTKYVRFITKLKATYLTTWLLMMGLTGEAWLGSVAMSAMMIEGKGSREPHYQTLQRKNIFNEEILNYPF